MAVREREPAITVGIPAAPALRRSGACPRRGRRAARARRRRRRPRARAAAPRCRAGARRGRQVGLDLERRALGEGVAQDPLRGRGEHLGVLARGDADRDAGRRRRHERRVAEAGLPAEDARHVERGLDERADVELLRGLRVERHRAPARAPRPPTAARSSPRAPRRPAASRPPAAAREPAVAGEERAESFGQRVDRVQRSRRSAPSGGRARRSETSRSSATRPRVATTSSGRLRRFIQPSRITQASAGPSSESRKRMIASPPVSSSRRRRRERSRGGALAHERRDRLELHPELALVVGDPARVQPLAARNGGERVALPGRAGPAAGRRSARRRGRPALRAGRRSRDDEPAVLRTSASPPRLRTCRRPTRPPGRRRRRGRGPR